MDIATDTKERKKLSSFFGELSLGVIGKAYPKTIRIGR
jgi:hypothetical protein